MERISAWKKYDETALKELEAISKRYRDFLDHGKTERECVKQAVALAEKNGYRSLQDVISHGKKLIAGDKVYSVCMDKAVMLFHLGKKPLESGVNIVGAHIDSPRIDIKQNPFYEDTDLAYARRNRVPRKMRLVYRAGRQQPDGHGVVVFLDYRVNVVI